MWKRLIAEEEAFQRGRPLESIMRSFLEYALRRGAQIFLE